MKRTGNLFERVSSIENLELADQKARKGKKNGYGIRIHDQNRESNIQELRKMLLAGTFRTSEYDVFKVYEPKEREVYRLPYYPDRIVHHAIMNVLEPIFTGVFTRDTYSCIKGRGIHSALSMLKKSLRDTAGTRYCLKLDIRKFYPSVDHGCLKQLLRRKLKDRRLLELLDGIIDSAPGLPIGNYLSQYLANYYLTFFDHWIKEEKKVRHYFRYADDIVVLSDSKEELHRLLSEIRSYLSEELKLEVKGNYQVFPVASRGIDFLGYVSYHTHTRLRKSIKKNFARMLARKPNPQSVASYYGWISHCNGRNLLKKLLDGDQFQRLGNKTGNRKLCRGKNKDIEDTEQGDQGTEIQDTGVEIHGQGRMPAPADSAR